MGLVVLTTNRPPLPPRLANHLDIYFWSFTVYDQAVYHHCSMMDATELIKLLLSV